MKNFDDIKSLWDQSGKSNELPTVKEIILKIKSTKRKMIRRTVLGSVILLFTFIFITWVGLHYDFNFITTRVGIIIILIAIVLGIVFNTRLFTLLAKQNDPTLNNNVFLEQLIKFRKRQRSIQTKGISVYFILLTTGITLYMYEFAARDLTFGIIAYSITLAWIAFNWFYLRKKSILKHEKEINEQISNLEKLMNNIEN
jgi:accessory gene regulator protein AgrB